ncbi:MAG TPA: hypothetical protein VGR62_08830 [Candidatus Binatia bacterium]|nr:hypothetical protein [Candidatus Binatia bacterium]
MLTRLITLGVALLLGVGITAAQEPQRGDEQCSPATCHSNDPCRVAFCLDNECRIDGLKGADAAHCAVESARESVSCLPASASRPLGAQLDRVEHFLLAVVDGTAKRRGPLLLRRLCRTIKQFAGGLPRRSACRESLRDVCPKIKDYQSYLEGG